MGNSAASVDDLKDALKKVGYDYPMDISRVRANSICCGDNADDTNRLSMFPWRKVRVYVGITPVAGTSLTMNIANAQVNNNGPDQTNTTTGATDTLSDQFLEEQGALVPTDCFFAIIGMGVEVCEPYQTPSSGQANAGMPTYLEFFGAEGAAFQSYTTQLKTAILRHSHSEFRKKGSSCVLATCDHAQLPNDAGVTSAAAVKAGYAYTNSFAYIRSPIIVSGVNVSGALQLNFSIDKTITISNHAANPIPAAAANTQFFMPVDLKIYGTSLPPNYYCGPSGAMMVK